MTIFINNNLVKTIFVLIILANVQCTLALPQSGFLQIRTSNSYSDIVIFTILAKFKTCWKWYVNERHNESALNLESTRRNFQSGNGKNCSLNDLRSVYDTLKEINIDVVKVVQDEYVIDLKFRNYYNATKISHLEELHAKLIRNSCYFTLETDPSKVYNGSFVNNCTDPNLGNALKQCPDSLTEIQRILRNTANNNNIFQLQEICPILRSKSIAYDNRTCNLLNIVNTIQMYFEELHVDRLQFTIEDSYWLDAPFCNDLHVENVDKLLKFLRKCDPASSKWNIAINCDDLSNLAECPNRGHLIEKDPKQINKLKSIYFTVKIAKNTFQLCLKDLNITFHDLNNFFALLDNCNTNTLNRITNAASKIEQFSSCHITPELNTYCPEYLKSIYNFFECKHLYQRKAYPGIINKIADICSDIGINNIISTSFPQYDPITSSDRKLCEIANINRTDELIYFLRECNATNESRFKTFCESLRRESFCWHDRRIIFDQFPDEISKLQSFAKQENNYDYNIEKCLKRKNYEISDVIVFLQSNLHKCVTNHLFHSIDVLNEIRYCQFTNWVEDYAKTSSDSTYWFAIFIPIAIVLCAVILTVICIKKPSLREKLINRIKQMKTNNGQNQAVRYENEDLHL